MLAVAKKKSNAYVAKATYGKMQFESKILLPHTGVIIAQREENTKTSNEKRKNKRQYFSWKSLRVCVTGPKVWVLADSIHTIG